MKTERTRKSRLYLLGLSLCCLGFGLSAYAQTVNTISGVAFGSYEFGPTFNGSIQLGTDGNATTTGFGITDFGGEIAGQVQVTAPLTGLIDVKCAATATLADPTASSLTIQNIEIAVNAGVGFSSGIACQGVGGGDPIATTIDLDATPSPNIYIGGEIMMVSPLTLPTDHTYDTGGAGTPIMLSIVTQ